MKISTWALASSLLYLMGFNMSGCGAFTTEPFVDAKEDEGGEVTLLDTSRNWRDWREAVDPQIDSEIAGIPAPGFPTWNEKWVRQLKAIRRTQENPQRYTTYIIQKRREAGLPELRGFP